MATEDTSKLSDEERTAAVGRAIKACSMCPVSMWPELAAHMKVPGVALTTGLILENYPEAEWSKVLQQAQKRSRLLAEILGAEACPEGDTDKTP